MRKKSQKWISFFCVILVLSALLPHVWAEATQIEGGYDPYTEGIVSSYYTIDAQKGYLTGVAPGTTAEQLQKVCLPENLTLSQDKVATGAVLTAKVDAPEPEPSEPPTEAPTEEVTEAPTEEVTEETTEETTGETTEETTGETTGETTDPLLQGQVRSGGILTQSQDAGEQKTYRLTVIVTGDLNGDGGVSITDMLMLKSNILGREIADTAKAAADVNYDGNVSITDFLRVKAHLLGKDKIAAGKNPSAEAKDPLILLSFEETKTWKPSAAADAFVVADTGIAKVNAQGKLTAGNKEGTTFVYGLDSQGKVLERAIVTVLKQKLTVTVDTDSCRIIAGKTQQLTARLNHPVTATITWSSADSSVASVSSTGKITAKKAGTTTITVALANGSSDKVSVRVVPPITGVETGKSLYKVKPDKTITVLLELTPAGVDEEFTWTSSNPSIAKVSEKGVVTGVKNGTVTITAKGKYSGLTATCKVKVCNVKQVAITFDDGPSPYTDQLLDFLKKNDMKVTFFLVGNRLNDYPKTLKRQVQEGHEIGYHSYAHVEQTTLSSAQVTSEFEKSEAILKKLTGAEFTLWRTPGGGFSQRVLNAVDLPHIMWSVDTYDWKVRNTETVYRQIVNQSKDGSIVLLHDLYSFSVNGAIKAMTEMQAGDYEFVTVTELLSRNGTPPKDHKTYYSG